MKSKRRNDLLKILRSGRASSQEEIADKLKAAGHDVTQATVSRDLREIGAVKVRADSGSIYKLADDVEPAGHDRSSRGSARAFDLTEANLKRTLERFAVDIKSAGTLVVVTTPPGHANAVARALDLAALRDAAGTIAGDDTIFVATTGPAVAKRLARYLQELSSAEEASP